MTAWVRENKALVADLAEGDSFKSGLRGKPASDMMSSLYIVAYHGFDFSVQSQEISATGKECSIKARQTVFFDPPGATSGMGGAMFAEFELAIHEEVEKGSALSGKRLTEIYGGILRRHHDQVHDVPAEAGYLLDINTPQEYKDAKRRFA